jgi:hypothetical protein
LTVSPASRSGSWTGARPLVSCFDYPLKLTRPGRGSKTVRTVRKAHQPCRHRWQSR